MVETVPGSLDDISPEWLTTALAAGGMLPPPDVASISMTPIGTDHGFTGVVARLRPAYRSAAGAGPDTLIVKLPTATQAAASAYRRAVDADPEATRLHYRRCAREVAFYRDLGGAGARTPRCYHAMACPERMRVALLLEDVPGVPGDKLAGCTPEQARATLRAIAPLHAAMWHREGPEWLPPFLTDPQASQQRYAERLEPFLARYGHQLPDEVRELLAALRGRYAEVLTELTDAPRTVIHGETHLDNLMFVGDEAVLLDWQSVRYGPAAFDVAEVLFASLSPADRRAREDDLLADYADLLSARGVADYPMDRLRHHCRLALMCHVVGQVGWLAIADPDQVSTRERAIFADAFGNGRLVAALQDHWLS